MAVALGELLEQHDHGTEVPWVLLLGRLPAADVAWTLAIHASQGGLRAAVLDYAMLLVFAGLGETDERAYRWVSEAADADICVLSELDEPPPNPPVGNPEVDCTDELVDLLLVRRRRHPGLTLLTTKPPEAQARKWIDAIHPGLIEQVERYRELRTIQVPDEPQLPGCPAEMGNILLTSDTDDANLMALCRDYWTVSDDGEYRDSVKAIAERYDLRVHEVAKTIARISTARSRDATCPSCGLGEVVTSRQDLAAHQQWRRAAECEDCQQARWERRRTNKDAWFGVVDVDPIDLAQLTLSEAVTLLALLRTRAGETLEQTIPLALWKDPFAPMDNIEGAWVLKLLDKKVLRIHHDSPMDAFEWEEDQPVRFYADRVSYYVAGRGAPAERSRSLVEALTATFRDGPWPEAWRSSWSEVWRELAVAECIAYLQLCLEDHRLSFSAGEKTADIFSDTLETFSIGQAYSFIWRAAKDAAAYMVREGIPRARAANSSVGAIKRFMERARASGWDISTYRRDRRLPVSELSHTFFMVVMHVPDLMAARRCDVSLPEVAIPRPPSPARPGSEESVVEEPLPPGAVLAQTVLSTSHPSRSVGSSRFRATRPAHAGR